MNYNRADAFRQDDDHREDDVDDEKFPKVPWQAAPVGFLPGEHVRFRLETHGEEDKSVSSTVEYGVVHSIEQGGSEGELSYTIHMYNHEHEEFEDPAASDGSMIGPLTLKEQIDQGIQPIDIVPNVTIVYEYEIDDSDSDLNFGEEEENDRTTTVALPRLRRRRRLILLPRRLERV